MYSIDEMYGGGYYPPTPLSPRMYVLYDIKGLGGRASYVKTI